MQSRGRNDPKGTGVQGWHRSQPDVCISQLLLFQLGLATARLSTCFWLVLNCHPLVHQDLPMAGLPWLPSPAPSSQTELQPAVTLLGFQTLLWPR